MGSKFLDLSTAPRFCLLACLAALPLFTPNSAFAQAPVASAAPPTQRDGQRDFDFEAGSRKIHLKRLLHPLTGSNTWVEFDGTSVTRKVWGGNAWIEEFETNGPTGKVEGLTFASTIPKLTSGASIGPIAKMDSSASPPSANSTMDAANSSIRRISTAGRFLYATSGRKLLPTPPTLNNPSPPTEAKPGKSTGSPTNSRRPADVAAELNEPEIRRDGNVGILHGGICSRDPQIPQAG